MAIGVVILRALSRHSTVNDEHQDAENGISGNALSLLRREFPQLSALVKGKRVVDFGCGLGKQSAALVREEGCYVCGIDTNPSALSKAKIVASEMELHENDLIFVERPTREMLQTFDIVISQDAMEHFPDPISALKDMKGLIGQGGKLLITFGPPWFAPYGSHMHFFCRIPWLNLLFSEKTVMTVRALFRNDGAKRYEEVESGLNKMTVSKFEKIIAHTGLVVQYKKYSCIKQQNWLAKLPVLRELCINHVSCILAYPCNNESQVAVAQNSSGRASVGNEEIREERFFRS